MIDRAPVDVTTRSGFCYQGPLNFGTMIEKELVEALWHPKRVARNMKIIDES